MCCLYSIPNLLVFQQSDTLYLGGNNVRVVCEKNVKNSSVWAFKRFLATGNSPKCHTWSMQEVKWSRQLEHYRTKIDSQAWQLTSNSFHSRDWVARMPCFAEKWLFIFLMYPTINIFISTKCRELLERILKEKP